MAAFSAGSPKASHPIGCMNIETLAALVARDHIAQRVAAQVAHMDAP